MTIFEDLLATVARGADPGPFALLRRDGRDRLDVLVGPVTTVDRLADIPLPDPAPAGPATLAVVPYRQIAERGFACVDDGSPLECLRVSAYQTVSLTRAVAALPDAAVTNGGGFDRGDEEYAEMVGAVLTEEIGRGGASTVYLAEDLKHGRKVAIKLFRPAPGGSYEPQRFLREIRIAARLAHPQILPLHDSGEIEPDRPGAPRLLYFVMPYAGCESLRNRLSREGPLPVAEAVRAIGISVPSYYRWRSEYGGLKLDQVKRLKQLEAENARLRKAVADLTLEKVILKEAASGNF